MTTRSGVQNTIIYDPARIDERYGLRPDQMIDFKALKGDSTDNIPGVPGVGEKTAAKLIGDYGTLDGALRAHRRGDAGEAARAAARGTATRSSMSRELMRIVRDLPVDARPRRGPAGRLRPRDGDPAVPRVRVPDASSSGCRRCRGERAEETAAAIRREASPPAASRCAPPQVPGSVARGSAGWGAGQRGATPGPGGLRAAAGRSISRRSTPASSPRWTARRADDGGAPTRPGRRRAATSPEGSAPADLHHRAGGRDR